MYWHQGCVNTAIVSIRRDGAKVRIQNCEGANTYIKNNSSKIFSCIGPSAKFNTGPTCIRAKIDSPGFLFLHVLVLCRGGDSRKDWLLQVLAPQNPQHPQDLSAPWHRNPNRKRLFESQTKSQGISAVRSKFWPFCIAKRIATATVLLPQKTTPPRIWTILWAPLAVSQSKWPYNEPSKTYCVQFWPRKRIADFDCKPSPEDGALSSRQKQHNMAGPPRRTGSLKRLAQAKHDQLSITQC